ncbi:unnamed protein product [Brassica napus]|uniref:Uncharacterized protein n=2 Tax=Brassica TaxID=3705 RepID=M4D575_BRACM|nr:unnamed protein product [Brassica napus]
MENMLIKKQLRSISLPSRSHPSTSGIEEALTKVKTINTTKSSFESISTGLAGLEELYDCTDEFLKMCSTQRAMSSVGSDFMEEMLDGSLRLMDICSVSRDLMVETQEHVRDLQSCVRRKKVAGGGEDQLTVAVSGYVKFRKNMRKETKKLLVSLKSIDGGSSSYDHEDEHVVAVIDAMRRVVSVSVSVLKKVIVGTTKGDSCSRDDIQEKLEEVEMSIGGFEKSLEGLFRRLIRTRASLLNIISH